MIPLLGPVLGIAKVVPIWAWGLAAVLAWGGFQKHRATSATKAAAVAEQRAAVESATVQAEAGARQREHELTTTTTKAADAYRSNLATAQRAAAAARTDLDRLRDAVGSAPACRADSASGAAGRVDGADAFRVVVRECSAALSEMAEVAGDREARVTGLQDYIKAIGAASAPPPRKDPP